MSGQAWEDANNRYLGASLAWLRLRLERLAAAGPGRGADDGLARAAVERDRAALMDPAPALVVLAERMGLSAFERDVVLLCAAAEFDPAFAGLCARAHGGGAHAYPTFGLAMSALESPRWDAVSPHRPLRRLRLLEVTQVGATPLTSAALRAEERVVNYLKGLNVLDDRLTPLVHPVTGVDRLSRTQDATVDEAVQRLRLAAERSEIPVLQLAGADEQCRVAVAQEVCRRLNRRLYKVGPEGAPGAGAEAELFARLWQREALLLPLALYIEADPLDAPAGDQLPALQRLVSRDIGLVLVGVRETAVRLPVASLSVQVGRPSAEEQREAWSSVLEGVGDQADADETAKLLAGQYRLSLGEISAAADQAAGARNGGVREALWRACREMARPRLDQLAQRLEAKATWGDLVLPGEQVSLLQQIAGQVRERHRVYSEWGYGSSMNRGFGINVLFAGESGTGKTMAAEVLANELDLALYRIDLSAVVSKYIGETEKNLRRVFDAAESGGTVLLFDEADALFGKRSEVRDSHDRYANIEVNYLLQRIEAFNGLSILATNMKTALDPAFLRRLRFVVNFPFPAVRERREIWRRAIPAASPRSELDFDRLARLNISGGNIHSISLNAAFAAAQDGKRVTMPILMAAARAELKKLDRPFNEAEFR